MINKECPHSNVVISKIQLTDSNRNETIFSVGYSENLYFRLTLGWLNHSIYSKILTYTCKDCGKIFPATKFEKKGKTMKPINLPNRKIESPKEFKLFERKTTPIQFIFIGVITIIVMVVYIIVLTPFV